MLLLLAWAGTRALAQSNPLRDSLDVATKALAMAPDSVDLRLKKAAWNIRLEQWSYAKADYDIILSHHPNNVTALFFRAFVNEKLNRYSFARIDYQNFLKLLPGHFEGQIGLILLNEKDKHYTEAMDGANTLIEQYPDSALAYAIRGGIEKERGMYMLAQYDYTPGHHTQSHQHRLYSQPRRNTTDARQESRGTTRPGYACGAGHTLRHPASIYINEQNKWQAESADNILSCRHHTSCSRQTGIIAT